MSEQSAVPISPDERWGAILDFVTRFSQLVPKRHACTKAAAAGVVQIWIEWSAALSPGKNLDRAIAQCREDLFFLKIEGWRFPDVACLFAEAHGLEGMEAEFWAFRDAALGAPAQLVQYSTAQRLEALKSTRATKRAKRDLTDAELDVLEALPQRTLAQIAERAGRPDDVVRHLSPILQRLKLMQRDEATGMWVRLPAAETKLREAGRLRSGS